MPTTDKKTALQVLVRKDKIRKEEWLELIEARRALIKKHLDNFTLRELGETKCLRKNYGGFDRELCAKLNFDNPEIISDDKKLSLKTQGIFHCQSWDSIKYDYPPNRGFPGGTIQIWGLARSGDWTIAEVVFTGGAGYKHRVLETAKSVKIEKTDLRTVLAITGEKPIEIWKKLGEAVKEWMKKRKELYDQAFEIYSIIKSENKALLLTTFFPIFD